MDFRKEMTGFYMHSVCLPEKVTKHFNDFVGKNLEFKCPSGDVWHVGLIRLGDRLVLQHGWSNFASSNNVLQNDILLFKLVSGSTFEVRIFNPLGWEKGDDFEGEARYSSRFKIVGWGNGVNPKTYEPEPNPRKRSWSQTCNSLPLRKRLKKSDCGSPCQEKEKTACEDVHKLLSEEREEFLESEGKYEISPPAKNMNRQEEETLEEATNNGLLVIEDQALLGRKLGLLENGTRETMTHTKNHSSQNQIDCGVPIDYVICGPRRWQAMSDEQKARANRLALKIQASNPAFLHLMQQSGLTKKPSIAVPKEFSVKHLEEGNQTFVLRLPEKENTWSVKYYFKRNRQSSIENGSFLKFIEENSLKKGDICIFELAIIQNQITFIVHVSRATFELKL